MKRILLENWEKKQLGDGKSEGVGRAETGDVLALQSRDSSKLQIVLQNKKKKTGKLAKFANLVQFAIAVIMAALVGDPTALVATFVASLINQLV